MKMFYNLLIILIIYLLVNLDLSKGNDYYEYENDYNSSDYETESENNQNNSYSDTTLVSKNNFNVSENLNEYNNKTNNNSEIIEDLKEHNIKTHNNSKDSEYLSEYFNKTLTNSESSNDIETDYENNDNDFENDFSISLINKLFDTLTDHDMDDIESHKQSNDTIVLNDSKVLFENLFVSYEKFSNYLNPINKQIGLRFSELLYSSDLSAECLASFIHISHGLNSRKLWAFKFIDSMGKIPSGLASGVSTSFGEYDQCLDIESDNKVNKFYGKYCLVKPVIPSNLLNSIVFNFENFNFTQLESNELKQLISFMKNNMNKIKLILAFSSTDFSIFRFGICLPSTCSSTEIQGLFNKFLYTKTNIPIEVGPECDVSEKSINLDNYQLISIIIFVTLITAVLLSTIFEIYHEIYAKNFKSLNNFSAKLKTSFSLISNTKLLFEANNRVRSADTILLMFIIWTFIARSYLSPLYIGTIGLKNVFNSIPNSLMTDKRYFWVRTPFPNETLIIISAFIVSYHYFGVKLVNHSLSTYLRFVLIKWLKLSRRMLGPILLVYILSIVGNGPLWSPLKQIFITPCKTNYIQCLLLFNNYFDSFDQMCNTSYLSAIFQLQIIAPLLLIPFSTPRYGYILNIYLIIMGCIICISPKLLYGINISPFEISIMKSLPEIRSSIIRYTQYTDQYISSFSMGILLGYLVRNKPNARIGGKFVEIILWIVCPLLSFASVVWGEIFIHYEQIDSNYVTKNRWSLMLCISVGKILWSLGVSWTVFACSTGRGGIMNKLFSLKIFIPLSRLSIGVLVLHSNIINFRIYTQKYIYVMSHSLMVEWIFADIIITFIIAYILHILIECPINNLIRLMVSKSSVCGEEYSMIYMNRKNVIKERINQDREEFKFIFPVD